jgi:hypothetical protein
MKLQASKVTNSLVSANEEVLRARDAKREAESDLDEAHKAILNLGPPRRRMSEDEKVREAAGARVSM